MKRRPFCTHRIWPWQQVSRFKLGEGPIKPGDPFHVSCWRIAETMWRWMDGELRRPNEVDA